MLIVGDKPLLAIDIADAFFRAGASVLTAWEREDELRLADRADVSFAVIDVSADSKIELRRRLRDRSIPFVLHNACLRVNEIYPALEGVVSQAATPTSLVDLVWQRLDRPAPSHVPNN